ncbi:MAG: nucleoside-diphosphate-sugar pyrophosphorylase [Desulfobacteraceae bacterium 4572_89]|nr:MAG: nucleoside-diphosphate-sugar pyrophosphorylase [Desulfobacteraceae bacterium 4572_89]
MEAQNRQTRLDTKSGNGTNDIAIVILAAGRGSRMKSDKPKVLHKVAKKSMVTHVLDSAVGLTRGNVYVVVGHQAQLVKDVISQVYPVNFVFQKNLLGTGDAVKQALPHLDPNVKDVLVLCGDVPLIKESTLVDLLENHRKTKAKLSVLAVKVTDPFGYGRIVLDEKGDVACIREEADATKAEKKITTINAGIYCFERIFIDEAIDNIRPDNRQSEYYLTDLVEIARSRKEKISVVVTDDSRQVMGVNTLDELEIAESMIQQIENELP